VRPTVSASLLAGCVLLFSGPAAGQATQPTGGGFSLSPQVVSSQYGAASTTSVTAMPERDGVFNEASAARFHLGPLKIQPQLFVGPAGYTNNLYGETDAERKGDYTVNVGGGVKAWLPIGHAVVLRGSVLPSYTWYARNSERSVWTGTYGTEALFFLKKVTIAVSGASGSGNVDLSSEVLQPVKQTVLNGNLAAEWKFSSRMALFANVNAERRTYGGAGLSQQDLDRLSALDATDLYTTVGIRRLFGSKLMIGLNYEHATFSYINTGSLRDAVSDGILATAYLDRGRLRVNVNAGFRDYRAASGSSATEVSGPSGGAGFSYQLGRIVWVGVQAYSSTIPSLDGANSVYVEERIGPALGLAFRTIGIGATYQVGQNRYLVDETISDGTSGKRRDDVRALTGTLSFPIYRTVGVAATCSWNEIRSNLAGMDRTVFQIGATLRLGGTIAGLIEIR
jgi:hypothetical protein